MANRVTRLLRFWLTLDGAVDRRSYLASGVALMIVKYFGDAWWKNFARSEIVSGNQRAA
jgi:hypothetical protein